MNYRVGLGSDTRRAVSGAAVPLSSGRVLRALTVAGSLFSDSPRFRSSCLTLALVRVQPKCSEQDDQYRGQFGTEHLPAHACCGDCGDNTRVPRADPAATSADLAAVSAELDAARYY